MQKLEYGSMVELRNGERLLYMNGQLFNLDKNSTHLLEDYREDLTSIDGEQYDIVRTYLNPEIIQAVGQIINKDTIEWDWERE